MARKFQVNLPFFRCIFGCMSACCPQGYQRWQNYHVFISVHFCCFHIVVYINIFRSLNVSCGRTNIGCKLNVYSTAPMILSLSLSLCWNYRILIKELVPSWETDMIKIVSESLETLRLQGSFSLFISSQRCLWETAEI